MRPLRQRAGSLAVAGSNGQTMAALGATSTNHGTTTAGCHTNEKAVGALAANDRRLVSAFHDKTLEVITK